MFRKASNASLNNATPYLSKEARKQEIMDLESKALKTSLLIQLGSELDAPSVPSLTYQKKSFAENPYEPIASMPIELPRFR